MHPAGQQLLVELRREARERYASWNDDLFQALVAGPADALWQKISNQSRADRVYEAYLLLLREAVASGHIQQADSQAAAENFLALVLLRLVPGQLPLVRANEQLPLLAKIWNLCEGLLQEPSWVDRYVVSRADDIDLIEYLDDFLKRVLQPVMTPSLPASWLGSFELTVLDTRIADDQFLPGEMRLGAPTVLCVRDRRRPVCLSVLLRKGRRSELLGLGPELTGYGESGPLPTAWIEPHTARIGEHTVPLPSLHTAHRALVARAGFFIASAVDSQRLWILESG